MTPEERIAKLEATVENLAEDLREIKADVKHTRSMLDQAKGAWKLYVALCGVSGAIGALLTKLAPLIGKG